MTITLGLSILSAFIVVEGAVAQAKPDFSGNWVLVSPSDAAANVAQELTVRQWVERRTSVRGKPVDFILVTIARQSKSGLRSESYQIGLGRGTVGGVDRTGRGPGPNGEVPGTEVLTKRDGDRLVIESSSYSGATREAGPYTERKEVWSLDAEGALFITTTERSSDVEPWTTNLTYRRR